jgi:hypothetical protein
VIWEKKKERKKRISHDGDVGEKRGGGVVLFPGDRWDEIREKRKDMMITREPNPNSKSQSSRIEIESKSNALRLRLDKETWGLKIGVEEVCLFCLVVCLSIAFSLCLSRREGREVGGCGRKVWYWIDIVEKNNKERKKGRKK